MKLLICKWVKPQVEAIWRTGMMVEEPAKKREFHALAALQHVEDPELHKSVVELNMVRNIQIEDTHVQLEVVLTIQGCPLKAHIQEDVERAIKRIGATTVFVHFATMTAEERAQLTQSLKKDATTETECPLCCVLILESTLSL